MSCHLFGELSGFEEDFLREESVDFALYGLVRVIARQVRVRVRRFARWFYGVQGIPDLGVPPGFLFLVVDPVLLHLCLRLPGSPLPVVLVALSVGIILFKKKVFLKVFVLFSELEWSFVLGIILIETLS